MQPSEDAQPLGKAANPPLGIFEGQFEMVTETIQPNAALLVVTDGVTEAGSPNGDLFGTDRLEELITNWQVNSAQNLIQLVTNSVADFRQTLPQQDDITVFALVNRK